jgi:hypothetical protein
MKLLNYDKRTLIMQNVKSAEKNPTPNKYSQTQYRILCNLIKRKHIQKPLFDFIISGLFDVTDWKKLNYSQMYTLIYVLTNWNYEKERKSHE